MVDIMQTCSALLRYPDFFKDSRSILQELIPSTAGWGGINPVSLPQMTFISPFGP